MTTLHAGRERQKSLVGDVYLIHFAKPFHHARHYLGFTQIGDLREEAHRLGQGSKLLRAVNEAGIEWKVVRVWKNVSRSFERNLKNRKQTSHFCPKCSGQKAHKRGLHMSMSKEQQAVNDLAAELTKKNSGEEKVTIGQVRETLRLMKEMEMEVLKTKPDSKNAPSRILHKAARADLKKAKK